jgi:hypothetical protein
MGEVRRCNIDWSIGTSRLLHDQTFFRESLSSGLSNDYKHHPDVTHSLTVHIQSKQIYSRNIALKSTALLLRVREILGWTLGPNRKIMKFSAVFSPHFHQTNTGTARKICHDRFLKTFFPIYLSLIIPPQEQPCILKCQLSFITGDHLHFEDQLEG